MTSKTAAAKRDRDGDALCPALQGLKDRHRAAWPTEAELDKYLAAIKADEEKGNSAQNTDNKSAASAAMSSASSPAQKEFANFIYRFHDQPHNARLEWWYINGHVGTCKATNTAYSFFAAFFKLHIMGDHYAYAVNWALTEVPHLETEFAAGAKTINLRPPPIFTNGSADNVGKYHTFASQDPITPMVIDTLMTQGKFKMADPRIAQQVQTMAKAGLLPAPDTLFTSAATCRGSADKDESLYVEIDGNVFSAVMPKGAEAPTYTMKLHGTTQKGEPGVPETSASLEISFSPSVAKGAGPVLQGVKGVVAVDNFENDMFYYFTPRCAVTENGGPKLTIDGKAIEVEGDREAQRIWVDHEFGGAPAATAEEVKALEREANDYNWDWGAFHVPGLASISIAIVREENPAIPPMIWGAVQPEYKGKGDTTAPFFSVYFDSARGLDDDTQEIRITTDTSVPTYNSPETGMIFPTAWTIHIPALKNLKMRTVSAIPQQEFINLMAKPAYLEGRAHIEASWVEEDGTARHAITGMGFMEARGVVNTALVEQVTMITHATVFMPAEMQPAPPAELLPALPGAILPTVSATITAMMAFAPPPKPKPNQVGFIAATVATYTSLLHFGADEAVAKRLLGWWIGEKKAYLTATALGVRAGVKDIGMAAMMQKELEGMLARKVPSVAAAAAKGDKDTAMEYVFAVEKELLGATPAAAAAPVPAVPAASAPAAAFDPSSIVALAASMGIPIPPEMAADPKGLVATAVAAGLPVPAEILAAVGLTPAPAAAAPTATTTTTTTSAPQQKFRARVGASKLPIPFEDALERPSTQSERDVAKSLVNGKWNYCGPLNIDSVSDYLGLQGVNMVIRMFAGAVKANLESTITDEEGGKSITKVHIITGPQDFVSFINGKSYTFEASGRGTMNSRACLLEGGKLFAQRNMLPCGTKGIEYKLFDVLSLKTLRDAVGLRGAQKLPDGVPLDRLVTRETTVFFSQAQVDEAAKNGGVYQSAPAGFMESFYLKTE